jgi:hypothetical protein
VPPNTKAFRKAPAAPYVFGQPPPPSAAEARRRQEEEEARRRFMQEHQAATTLQASWRGTKARRYSRQLRESKDAEKAAATLAEESKAAVKIQANWRGHKARTQVKTEQQVKERAVTFARQSDAAITLQAHFRGRKVRRESQILREEMAEAARPSARILPESTWLRPAPDTPVNWMLIPNTRARTTCHILFPRAPGDDGSTAPTVFLNTWNFCLNMRLIF